MLIEYNKTKSSDGKKAGLIPILLVEIQLVVWYQCCVLIG